MSPTLRIAVALLVAAGLLVAGCGDDASAPIPDRPLTSDEIARYEAGSPERAVAEWWRDVQFNNARGVASRYAPGADVAPEILQNQISRSETFFSGKPRVDAVERVGDRATVYVLVLGGTGRGGRPEAVPLRLKMVDGEWKIADNELLERLAAERAPSAGTSPTTTSAGPSKDKGRSDDKRGASNSSQESATGSTTEEEAGATVP